MILGGLLRARIRRSPHSLQPFLWRSVFILSVSALTLRSSQIHLDAAPLDVPLHSEETLTDPATNIQFPTYLRIPSKIPLPIFSLVGVGVRTVSFLGVKVYSVGFYADLRDPNLNIPKTATPDEKVEHIIRNTTCVIRIIPTRSTSYTHLRDAFLRTLHSRLRLALTNSVLTPEDEQRLQTPLRTLKSIFPSSPLAKHTPLDILLSPPSRDGKYERTLLIRDLGAVQSDWMATEFMLAYFQGDGPSPALKKNVMERLEKWGS